jgi:hypothetical protein
MEDTMNWKLISMVALAALFAVTACKKKEEAKKDDKAGQTEKGGTTEQAAERPAAKDAWEAYIYRSLDCAKEMAGEGWSAEAEAVMKTAAEQGLEALKGSGSEETAAKAMEACKDKPCSEFDTCFMTELTNAMTAAATAAAGGGEQPAGGGEQPAGGGTASADGPCAAYVEKSIELWKKEAGEMPAEAMEQALAGMRDSWIQSCQLTGQALGESFNADMVAKANEACADKTTLTDFTMCWATKLTEAAMAAAGVPVP